MGGVSKDVIDRVKKIDLLTYLKNYEPDELVYKAKGEYRTKTHGSLTISNGLWNWFRGGVGGKNALDYLMKIKGMKFLEGVKYLANLENIKDVKIEQRGCKKDSIIDDKVRLILPNKYVNNDRVKLYLKSRGIDERIINKCIEKDLIYEDTNHNVVFVGYDEKKIARYAGARATNSSRFMHDITGSNKAYSFKLESNNKVKQIHIFEGAIDLLSFASLLLINNIDYENYTLISLAGVYQPAKIIEQSKIPKTIEKYLVSHESINEIVLHFDNDIAGRNATNAFQKVISKRYKVLDEPSPVGKDINDYLCSYLGIRSIKKERVR